MSNVLTLVHFKQAEFDFRLLWNGRAMFGFEDLEIPYEEITPRNTFGLAAMLHIMGQECAAVCARWGYPCDTVPSEEDLAEYLSAPERLPWELRAAFDAAVECMTCGNYQDYRPQEDSNVDLSLLELKKN